MSDKFDFDQFEDAQEDFDFDQFDDVEEVEAKKDISKLESAAKGAQQGLTSGFADEIGAGVQAGLDDAQRLLNEFTGIVGKSPTQVTDELVSQGFTGDLGPMGGEMYDAALEENRAEFEEAEKANPKSFMAGDIFAGLLLPGGAAGSAAKAGTKLAAKEAVKRGALSGAGMGALEAAGRTEEDLVSLEGLADVAQGTLTGVALGGLAGKISKKGSKEVLSKKADDLLERAEDTALRSSNISPKDMSDQIEKQVTTGVTEGPGVFGIEQGIIDPMLKPKGAYKKAREVKSKIGDQYSKLSDRFAGKSNLGDAQARKIAEDNIARITEGVEDAMAKTDDLTGAVEDKIRRDVEFLKEDLVQAYTSENPVKELQDLYVKYNDKFFSNIKSPSGMARKQLRTELKNIQRDFVKTLDPDAFDEFKKLDEQFTKVLDLEQITKAEAGRNQVAGGISDLSRGATAEVVTRIPGISAPVAGVSILSKKFLEKDIADFAEALKASRMLKKSKKLKARADKASDESFAPFTAAGAATSSSSVVDENKSREPVSRANQIGSYIEQATPETLQAASTNVREEYGKDGEKLANTLDKISQRDLQGRRSLIFSVLQDPNNRRMLGLTDEEE